MDFEVSCVAAESSFEDQLNKNLENRNILKFKEILPISKDFVSQNLQEMQTVQFDAEKDLNYENMPEQNAAEKTHISDTIDRYETMGGTMLSDKVWKR